MKNSFVLYTDYKKHMDLLNMEQRGILITALMCYQSEEELPEMDAVTSMAFSFIQSQMDKDNEKYEETVQKRKEAGAKSAEMRRTNSTSVKCVEQKGTKSTSVKCVESNLTNSTDNDNENDNDNVINKKDRAKSTRFVPPSLDEVTSFIQEKKYSVDPVSFIAFYESKNWMVGKSKMVDWKASVTGWNARNKASPSKKSDFNQIETRDYDFDELERIARGR